MATYNPPTNVKAAWSSARTGIAVTWTNPTNNPMPSWTTVERSVNGGSWTFDYTTLARTATSFTDTDVSSTNYYQYKVGYTRGTEGGWVETSIVPKKPNAPTGCTASRSTDTRAVVSWTFGAYDETNMPDYALIERQTDAGSWVQIASPWASVSSYVDNSISANHRYRYRVRWSNGAGYSAYSTSGYIYTTPAAPTKVTPTKVSDGVVEVAATVSAPYATGYDVERSTDSGSTWTSIATNASLPYTDSISAPTVRYRVRSVRGSLASAWKQSADIAADVPPLAPTITAKPSAITASGTACTISWTPNHPDGSAQSQAQVLVTAPDSTQTTATLGAMTSYTFTPDSVGIWTAQVRTHGLAASWGAWSQTIEWRMADRPIVAITDPASDVTEVDDLPLLIAWDVTDVSGVSSQKVTVALDGDAVYTRTPATSVRSLQVTRYDAAFEDGEAYTISIRVVNGYGLDTTAVRTFAIGWDLPSVPDITVEEGEGASASITVGTGPGSTVPTESITVQRVAPDGSAWTVAAGLQDGDTVSDPLAPLGVDVTYRAIAYASSGASSASEAVANIRSSGWVLGFGDTAGEWLVLVGNPDASYSLEQGGELFHFADGGAGGGLPVWYGTTDRDEGGSLSFGTVGQHDSDRLRELARKWPVGWLRDPFGHRWRARILPSVKHGLGELWTVGIDWTAVRWREAWDG